MYDDFDGRGVIIFQQKFVVVVVVVVGVGGEYSVFVT